MTPFNFLMEIRAGLREMIENEPRPEAVEFFNKVAMGKDRAIPKPIIEGEVVNKEVECDNTGPDKTSSTS